MNGINDAVLLLNLIKGGAVRFNNKCYGTTGKANEGSETTLPSEDEWSYVCTIMANLRDAGVTMLRTGMHDWQGTQAAMSAGAGVVAEKCLLILDAASLYNIKVVIVLGGFSDASTAANGSRLFEVGSPVYELFVQYAAGVADALHDTNVELVELVNEPDYVSITWASVDKFIEWETIILADVRARQTKPGVPLGMGTAVDSSLYPMDWWGEMSGQKKVIDSILRPCDVASVHTYIGEPSSYARKVWTEQKVPAFKAAAKRLGKKLIIGETGLLYAGGTYDAGMASALKDVPHCWMVRKHDPKVYTVPTIPNRPSSTPAPETPAGPTSEDLNEPPAQGTPEAPMVELPVIEEPPVVEPTPEPPPTVKRTWAQAFMDFVSKWFRNCSW